MLAAVILGILGVAVINEILLLRSGVPILEALRIVKDVVDNAVMAEVVEVIHDRIVEGTDISTPLRKSKIFPPVVGHMIAIGERSGALEVLLEKIAEFYDAQVNAAIKSLTSLIEPLLISFMGVIVGGVVLSVFLPILDIVGKLS